MRQAWIVVLTVVGALILSAPASLAASPVQLQSSTLETNNRPTFHAHFTNTGAVSTTMLIDLELYNQAGDKLGQAFFDNQNFNPGETREYNLTATGNLPAGAYRFAAGVFSPGWQSLAQWYNEPAVFSRGEQVTPDISLVDHGQTWVSLHNNGDAPAQVVVDLELYDRTGQQVTQKFFEHETLAPGESKRYDLGPVFLVPTNEPYVFKVGIFKPFWGELIRWYDQVVTITIAH